MKRIGLLVLVAAVLVGSAACNKKEPVLTQPSPTTALPTGSAAATAPPSGAPSATAEPNHFTVEGAGPYRIGAALEALRPQLDEIKTGGETCAANTTAKGKGAWKDIQMSFRPDGKIYIVINRSTTIPTPSGAWVGMTLASVSSIYGPIGQELTQGPHTAYLVTTDTGRGMMFDLDDSKKVIAMIAGEANYLKTSFLGGTDYC
ncbi:hypothetical protein [Allorhizocola rhizosphaerae]|uniref:hypothetical protein n=1 Tax=Allorhizocola rhizosphaerae TaxID=1872709 RepID=UPI0013C2D975|nr:hypothetical protein [Allorhizocola rhizosphaerae]